MNDVSPIDVLQGNAGGAGVFFVDPKEGLMNDVSPRFLVAAMAAS